MHAYRISLTLLAVVTLACTDSSSNPPTAAGASRDDDRVALSRGGEGQGDGRSIDIRDDCDPADLAWDPTGGCTLKLGDTDGAEFNALLGSPLSSATVGHPAWRNDPSYVQVRLGEEVKVTNRGGRLHTLTPVAQFGGGRIPPLNIGLTMAPECQLAAGAEDPFELLPGESARLPAMGLGVHRVQCCIHPWMRGLIRVSEHSGH